MSLRTVVQGASMSNGIAAGLSTFTRRHQTMNRSVNWCDRLGKDPDDDRRYVVLSMSTVFQGCGERRSLVIGGYTHLEMRHVLTTATLPHVAGPDDIWCYMRQSGGHL
jgi:hypothetical protein